VQRSVVTGQVELDLGLDLDLDLNSNNNTQAPEQITTGPYIYRAIATNLEILSDSKVVHFYNQRAEDSENQDKLQISKYKALALKSAQGICLAPKSFFNSLIRFSLSSARWL
jgi:hypothetical protein